MSEKIGVMILGSLLGLILGLTICACIKHCQ